MTPPAELFPASEVASESPRLRWLREHGLTCWATSFPDMTGKRCPETGAVFCAWYCAPEWFVELVGEARYKNLHHYSGGSTADEAVANYAAAHGLKLWNE